MNSEETKSIQVKELRLIRYEIQQAKRPAHEVILDDGDNAPSKNFQKDIAVHEIKSCSNLSQV